MSRSAVIPALLAAAFSSSRNAHAELPSPEADAPAPPHALVDELPPAVTPHRGAVLDLCALRSDSDGSRSVRQRALVFGPAGFERLDSDPVLRELGAARHAREAFISGLPLDRLFQVITTTPPDPAWLLRDSIESHELASYLLASTSPAIVGGADRQAQERALAAYSVGCADWILVPVIDRVSWQWRWFDPPTQKLSLLLSGPAVAPDGTNPLMNGNAMLLPDITFAGRVGAYQREGDRFVRVAVATGDTLRDVGMPDYPPADWGSGVPDFVSAIPDASCTLGVPRDGEPGVRCGGGVLDGDFLSKGKNEFSIGVCRARNLNNPEVWVACIARLEAEKVAGGAQVKLRKVRGINLFDELRDLGGRPAIRIGRREGVKVGYGFYVPDEHGKMVSYLKVTDVGSGGEQGTFDPTLLRSRFGATPYGARVYEYPQSNLYLAPRLGGGALAGMAGPTMLTSGPLAGQTVEFPTWVGGVSLGAAWDFSGTVNSPEWRTTAEIHALGSATSTVRLGMLLVDWPSIEKGFYVGPRLKAFASLAFAWGWVWASVREDAMLSVGGGGAALELQSSGSRARLSGISGTLGLEYMLRPDRLLRVDMSWRAHGAATLSSSPDTPGLEQRSDHYNAVLLRVGLELGR